MATAAGTRTVLTGKGFAGLEQVRSRYEDFGPTLAAEHLASEEGIEVHAETLRRWVREAGLWRRARRRQPYRQRRERKAHFGELVQLDGSFHDWLEERGGRGQIFREVQHCAKKIADGYIETPLRNPLRQ